MLKNYFKIAWRVLLKSKVYSFINLGGLAIGMACCLLIVLYVRDELSYDQFHENAHRIYRVLAESGNEEDRVLESANTSFRVGPALKQSFPEVLDAIRFREGYRGVLSYGEKSFAEKKFYFVDPTVFEVFTFEFAIGDPKTALAQPNNVVLTERTARKYFGDADPIGQVLHYEGWAGPADLTVTGVLKNLPQNTHFDFDFLGSLDIIDTSDFYWTWFTSLWTYILLPENYPPEQLQAKFPDFIDRQIKPNLDRDESWFILDLEPLTDIHLYSQLDVQMKPTSNILFVYLFSAIAAIILILACINFTNLATARSLKRAKEVGMRKALGSQRYELIAQFLGESMLICILALALAIALAELSLPLFNSLAEKAIRIDYFNDGFVLLALFGTVLVTGLLSGSYPAFALSRFQPVTVLKGTPGTGQTGSFTLRKSLVVFQFFISIVLIISVIAISSQLEFIRAKNLGANIEQVVVIPMSEKAESFLNTIKQNSNVINASVSSRVPVEIESFDTRPVFVQGFEKPIQMENFNIDEDFLATYQIELVAGRNLSRQFASDSTAFLLNESAVQAFGWGTPEMAIGKQIGWQFNYKKGQVVGVVKDFHMVSLHEAISPLILHKLPEAYWYNFISVRLRPQDISESLAFIEETWQNFNPRGGYDYFFVDDSFAKIHRADVRFGQVVSVFTAMAIVIACLGLFGLISYTAEQRTKEIGIRKVLGASVAGIVRLLSKEFVKLVMIANLVAWPIAWYAMRLWLQNFAYRIELNFWHLLLAGSVALLIAIASVSSQAIKAALADPVKALRYE